MSNDCQYLGHLILKFPQYLNDNFKFFLKHLKFKYDLVSPFDNCFPQLKTSIMINYHWLLKS